MATMPYDVVNKLVETCINASEYIIPKLNKSIRGKHWNGRLSVVLEVLSRLIVRLDTERSSEMLGRVLGWYSDIIKSIDFALRNPVRHLLLRTWETLPRDLQGKHVIDLLRAPIPSVAGFSERADKFQYPDPIDAVRDYRNIEVTRTETNDGSWKNIVRTVRSALRSDGDVRQRGIRRLVALTKLKVLTKEESITLAQGLWKPSDSVDCQFPEETGILEEWVFMVLPEPREGVSENNFREKWLSNSIDIRRNPSEILWQVGSAIENLSARGTEFQISSEEMEFLTDVVESWVQEPIPMELRVIGAMREAFADNEVQEIQKVIVGLRNILWKIAISEHCAEKIYNKWMKLNSLEIPVFDLIHVLIKILPNKKSILIQTLRTGLASDDPKTAINAISTLQNWLKSRRTEDEETEFIQPPIDLIQEVGVIVSTRRRAALLEGLLLSNWIVENGTEKEKNTIKPLLIQGLNYLNEELKYERGERKYDNVPELRWACTRLAVSMNNQNWAEPDGIVSMWIENVNSDPLPEVRNIFDNCGQIPATE